MGHVQKSLRSPNLHRKEHGCRKVFFPGLGNSGEIHFTNWKLRDEHFSTKKLIRKYQEKCLPRFFICRYFVANLSLLPDHIKHAVNFM